MTPAALAETVRAAAVRAVGDHGLDASLVPEAVSVLPPRDPGHGDYATNLALQVAGPAGVDARELASWLAAELVGEPVIAGAEVAGPGFVNLRLAPAVAGGTVAQVLAEGADHGRGDALTGRAVVLEVVPGAGVERRTRVAEALARLLAFQGAETAVEHRVPGAPDRADRFVRSLAAAAKGEPTPEGGFAGGHLGDIAAEVLRREPDALSRPDGADVFRSLGLPLLSDLLADCFDGARPSGELWLAVVPADRNEPGAVAVDPGVRPPGPAEGIGDDERRFADLWSRVDSPVALDPAHWATRGEDNPLHRVQYAHSRAVALLRNGSDLGVGFPGTVDFGLLTHSREGGLARTIGEFPRVAATAARTREPHRLAHHLDAVAGAFAVFTATCRVLPSGDGHPAPEHAARLALCAAARQVLATGLGLLGVVARERV